MFKRILAVLAIVVLLSLYVISLILALIGSPQAIEALKTAVFLTVLIPILLWIYLSMYRYIMNQKNANRKSSSSDSDDSDSK